MNRLAASLFVACVALMSLPVEARLPEFTKLVEEAAPAVVNIRATRERQSMQERFDGEEMPEFFRRFFEQMPNQPRQTPSAGSGFILSEDGYILTNYHVVADADEIIVSLNDRRERTAEIIGADEFSDLALLKVEAEDLPTVDLGKSSELKPGEWVLAIGSPFGFEYSVTAGIVSATGRSLRGPDGQSSYVPFIQTDVAINPGNSGGPLFNLEGEVVGINSQIFTRSGGFMGLSFAIPIDMAMDVVAQLKEDGRVSRGWLGVLIRPVNRDLAEAFQMERAAGALVTQVFADSPAAAAGIREGDIIVRFGDTPIDLSSELPHVVGRMKPNSEVDALIVRNGDRKTIKVTVGELDEEGLPTMGSNREEEASGSRTGLEVRDLLDDEKERLRVREGVLVTAVTGNPARDADIRRGDVITSFNNEPVESVEDFERLVDAQRPDVAIPIRIVRGGTPDFTVIKLPE